MAEKAIQITKNLLRKATKDGTDLQLALLDYRNTPRDFVLGSPVQRSMGRRTRTRMPTTSTLLKPELITPESVTNKLKQCRSKNKTYYDKQAKPLPPIKEGDSIRYRTNKTWTPSKELDVYEPVKHYALARQDFTKPDRSNVILNPKTCLMLWNLSVLSNLLIYPILCPVMTLDRKLNPCNLQPSNQNKLDQAGFETISETTRLH